MGVTQALPRANKLDFDIDHFSVGRLQGSQPEPAFLQKPKTKNQKPKTKNQKPKTKNQVESLFAANAGCW